MDYDSGMLPSLHFQTRVRTDSQIEYKFYSKPMASGLTIQKGTALAKQTVFSSLRQDLIRCLSNISEHFSVQKQVDTIEDYIDAWLIVDTGEISSSQ